MDFASATGSVFAAFGLSGAAGLNAYIPLFAMGLLDRAGVLDLSGPYDKLGATPVLIVLGVLFAADFVGDKVPAVDHVLHAAGTVVHPAAGAIAFAGQTGVAGDMPPWLALLLGAVVAGSFHGTRATIRPVSTAGTGGLGNPVLSLLEDGVSAALTGMAFLLPLLAFLFVAGVLIALVISWRTVRDRWRRRRPAT